MTSASVLDVNTFDFTGVIEYIIAAEKEEASIYSLICRYCYRYIGGIRQLDDAVISSFIRESMGVVCALLPPERVFERHGFMWFRGQII